MIQSLVLYDTCVIPTMLYSAEVFGYINPSNCEKNTKKNIMHAKILEQGYNYG